MAVKEQIALPSQRICSRCKFVSSQEVCKACILLEGLNKGLPKLGIGKSSKAKKMLEEYARNKGEEQLKQAVSELNDDINGAKYRSCKSCTCNKENNESSTSNIDIDSETSMANAKCTTNCGKKCNGHASQDEIHSESKINRLLEEFSIEESDKTISDTSKVLNKKKDARANSIEELLKVEESCNGGCEGMAISF